MLFTRMGDLHTYCGGGRVPAMDGGWRESVDPLDRDSPDRARPVRRLESAWGYTVAISRA